MFEALTTSLKNNYSLDFIALGWGTILLQYVILSCIERLRPAEPNQPLTGILTNAKITVVYLLLTPAMSAVPALTANSLVQVLGGGWVTADLTAIAAGYPISIRWVAEAALAFFPLIVFDFFYYWFHRAQHANRWLWQQHQLHHADRSFNVTTTERHHWLEQPIRVFLILIPMNCLVKMTPTESVLIGTLLGAWGYIIHMNIRLGFGRLSKVFAGPQVHRIHHSMLHQHRDKNFAGFFPVWDILFGTFYQPKAGEYPPTGIDGVPSEASMKTILLGPFAAWKRMLSEKRTGGKSVSV